VRTCADYGELQLWAAAPDVASLVRAEHLAVVRFELIERGGAAAGWIDLTFAHAARTCVLPGILVDLPLGLQGDPAAFAWPRAAGAMLDVEVAQALAQRLLVQFAAWTSARVVPAEAIAYEVPCPPFDAARAAEDVGAAPLRAVLLRVAPWVYVARLAGRGPAQVESTDAALGAAVLRRFGVPAAGVVDERAAAWYALAREAPTERPGLIVRDRAPDDDGGGVTVVLRERPAPAGRWCTVGVTLPVPMDVAFAFEIGDAPAARHVWVRTPSAPAPTASARAPVARRRPAVPLAFLVRDDFERVPDADVDEIGALLQVAHANGVETRILAQQQVGALDPRALPIAAGDVRDVAFCAVIETLVRRGGPFIVWLQPIGAYPHWHERVLGVALRQPTDDAQLLAAARAYDLRALVLEDVPMTEPAEQQAQRERLAAGLANAPAVVLPATQSLAVVAQEYGLRGRPLVPIPPIVPAEERNAAASSAWGDAPFIFAHGAAEPRSMLLLAVLALRDAAIPLVVAADGVDVAYAAVLRSLAGPYTTVLANVPPELVGECYRRAAIALDLTLRPRGLARLVRSARAGALPVVFADSPLAPLLDTDTVVPRRGVSDLRDALTTLWHSPLRAQQARAAARELSQLDRADVAVADLFGAICDLTGG